MIKQDHGGRPGEGRIWIGRAALVRLQEPARLLALRAARSPARGAGAHLSRFKGRGMEFDEARPYQPGDDIRALDWRVTARTGRPHTKLFREERERAVVLWVDFRSPMYFATRGVFKSVLAARVAALAGWAARHHGDRLGGLAFSEAGHREVRPRNGERAVLEWIALLSDLSARGPTQGSHHQRAEALRSALLRLRRVARPGSLVFLISDFRDLDVALQPHLTALARHTDLVLVHLYDRLEAELPAPGFYPVSSAGRTRLLDAADPARRAGHEQRHREHVEQLEGLCRRLGAHFLSCSTLDDPTRLLLDRMGRQPK